MNNLIKINPINEAYSQFETEDEGLFKRLYNDLTIEIPNAKYMMKGRYVAWDGKLKLLNARNGYFYKGLTSYVKKMLVSYGYDLGHIIDYTLDEEEPITPEAFKKFIDELDVKIPGYKVNKDQYVLQLKGAFLSVKNKRQVLLSPTASGKSLIIYLITQWYLKNNKTNILIITPTINLVKQLLSDFKDYGMDTEKYCHFIMAGEDKIDSKNRPVTISTWQSIHKLEKSWFDRYQVIVGDECLHPDTLIDMADGTKKKISKISVGDFVVTFNETEQRLENKPVLKVHHNISINEQMYEITLSNNTKIKITGNHKVLLTSNLWKRVDQLKIGETINSIE